MTPPFRPCGLKYASLLIVFFRVHRAPPMNPGASVWRWEKQRQLPGEARSPVWWCWCWWLVATQARGDEEMGMSVATKYYEVGERLLSTPVSALMCSAQQLREAANMPPMPDVVGTYHISVGAGGVGCGISEEMARGGARAWGLSSRSSPSPFLSPHLSSSVLVLGRGRPSRGAARGAPRPVGRAAG
jgi:hypothetical protein